MAEACITKITKNELRSELQKAIDDKLREFGDRYDPALSPRVAMRQAAKDAIKDLTAAKIDAARNTLTQKELGERIKTDKNPLMGARAILDHDVRIDAKSGNQFFNVRDFAFAVQGNIRRAGGEAFLELMQPYTASLRNLATPWRALARKQGYDEGELLKGIVGLPTQNVKMQSLGEAINKAIDYTTATYQSFGGRGERIKRILPHDWVDTKVVQTPKADWVNQHMGNVPGTNKPMLNRGLMIDSATKLPLDDIKTREVLGNAYDYVASNGLSEVAKKPGTIKSNLERPHDMVAYSPEGYMHAQQFWMHDSIAGSIMGWFDRMAMDISIQKNLGSNRDQAKRYVADQLRLATPGTTGEANARKWDHYFETFTHTSTLQRPINPNVSMGFSTARQVARFVYLGSSAIRTAIFGDNGVIANRMILNNIGMSKYLSEMPKAFANGDISAREALLHGDLWDSRAFGMFDHARTFGENAFSSQVVNGVAHTVLNASGLEKIPLNERLALARGIRQSLVEDASKSFDQVKAKGLLERYGITASDWDTYRATLAQINSTPGRYTHDFDTTKLFEDEATRDIGYRFKAMEIAETRSTVFSDPHALVEAAVNQGQRGTFTGELMRSVFQFGQWPMNSWWHQFGGPIKSDMPFVTKAKYMAGATLAATIASILSIQTGQIIQGKEPYALDGTLIAQAMLASDLMSWQGDAVTRVLGLQDPRSEQYGKVQHAMDMIPVAGLTYNLLGKPIGDAIHGYQQTHDLVKAIGHINVTRSVGDFSHLFGAPFGMQLWFTKAAFERLVVNNLEEMLDPSGYRNRQSRISATMRQNHQGYLWSPPK